MTVWARVIAIGQAAAGDDGVGLAVLEMLRAGSAPEGVELCRASDDSAVVALLETAVPVVLIDAVLGDPPGEVLELTPEELDTRGLTPVSSHGLGLAKAVALARIVAAEDVAPFIRIVAVTIARPQRYQQGLSPAVAAAVPRAVAQVLALVGGRHRYDAGPDRRRPRVET